MPDLFMPNQAARRPAAVRQPGRDHRPVLLAAGTLAAAALVLIAPVLLGRFGVNVLTRSMIYAMLAITVDLVWGYAGMLTFAHGAFFGIGAYATAMIFTHAGATPGVAALALLAAVALPGLFAAFIGWISFYQGASLLYATVVSLVVPIVVTQLVFSGGTLTGSSSGLVGYDTLPLSLGGGFRLVGLCLVALTCAALVFVRSERGRLLVAVRDNERRLAYLGIRTARVKIALSAAAAMICGLAGFLYANTSGMVAPENTSFVFGTQLVIWTALGGRATILGPVLSAIGIDYLSASLSGSLPFLWQLVVGTLFVVMIIVLPRGLASLFRRRRHGTAVAPLSDALPLRSVSSASVPVSGPEHEAGALLSIAGLGRSYGSLAVLSGIDLDIRPGELVSIVGPNGAGKSTLMRCLADGRTPYNGSIRFAGIDLVGLPPERVAGIGLGLKFQVASVFDGLTVSECLRTARLRRERASWVRPTRALGLPDAAIGILRLSGLDRMMGQPAALLSHGQKQALELAMVVAMEPRLILLDEPTAGLTKTERTTIGAILRELTQTGGIAAILVEHDLDFVREISSRIVVLHQGRLVLDGSVDAVIQSETVRAIYAGGAHV